MHVWGERNCLSFETAVVVIEPLFPSIDRSGALPRDHRSPCLYNIVVNQIFLPLNYDPLSSFISVLAMQLLAGGVRRSRFIASLNRLSVGCVTTPRKHSGDFTGV